MDKFTLFQKAAIKAVKILMYLAFAVTVGVISSPDFKSWIAAQPQLAAYLVIINIVLGVLKTVLQHYIDSKNVITDSVKEVDIVPTPITYPSPDIKPMETTVNVQANPDGTISATTENKQNVLTPTN